MKIPLLSAAIAVLVSACGPASGTTVTLQEYGDRWPFTVESGVLECGRSGVTDAVTFTSGGTTYSLNGTADTFASSKGWADVGPIWRDNPAGPGPKVDLSPLVTRGMALCT